MTDYGYLQHGKAGQSMLTERVPVLHQYADNYVAYFVGKWRRVHIQVKRLFIVYNGEKINIQIEGV